MSAIDVATSRADTESTETPRVLVLVVRCPHDERFVRDLRLACASTVGVVTEFQSLERGGCRTLGAKLESADVPFVAIVDATTLVLRDDWLAVLVASLVRARRPAVIGRSADAGFGTSPDPVRAPAPPSGTTQFLHRGLLVMARETLISAGRHEVIGLPRWDVWLTSRLRSLGVEILDSRNICLDASEPGVGARTAVAVCSVYDDPLRFDERSRRAMRNGLRFPGLRKERRLEDEPASWSLDGAARFGRLGGVAVLEGRCVRGGLKRDAIGRDGGIRLRGSFVGEAIELRLRGVDRTRGYAVRVYPSDLLICSGDWVLLRRRRAIPGDRVDVEFSVEGSAIDVWENGDCIARTEDFDMESGFTYIGVHDAVLRIEECATWESVR